MPIESFYSFINNKDNVVRICDEIISHPKDVENKVKWDYEFTLSKGAMEDSPYNTVLRFDAEAGSAVKELVTELSDTSFIVTEEIQNDFMNFIDSIKKHLSKSKYQSALKEIIRANALKNAPKEVFPMFFCDIVKLEIYDLPDIDFVVSIMKTNKESSVSGNSVSKILLEEHYRTNESFDVIFNKFKKSNHPAFSNVAGIRCEKSEYECSLYLKVDFNPMNPSIGHIV